MDFVYTTVQRHILFMVFTAYILRDHNARKFTKQNFSILENALCGEEHYTYVSSQSLCIVFIVIYCE